MPLYEADLDKLAVEVKSVSKKRSKKDVEPKKDIEPKKRVRVSKKKVSESKSCDSKTITDDAVEPAKPEPEPVVPEPIAEPIAVPEPVPLAEPVSKPVKEKKARAPRQKKDPALAPVWFAKYVEGVKKEQATMKSDKTPAKKVKEEAKEAATKSWNNGLTRNRVQNEVDGHSKILLT